MIWKLPDRSSWLLLPSSMARGSSDLIDGLKFRSSSFPPLDFLILSFPPTYATIPARCHMLSHPTFPFCCSLFLLCVRPSPPCLFSRYVLASGHDHMYTIHFPFHSPSRFTLHIFYFASCFRIITIGCMTYFAMPHFIFSFRQTYARPLIDIFSWPFSLSCG